MQTKETTQKCHMDIEFYGTAEQRKKVMRYMRWLTARFNKKGGQQLSYMIRLKSCQRRRAEH